MFGITMFLLSSQLEDDIQLNKSTVWHYNVLLSFQPEDDIQLNKSKHFENVIIIIATIILEHNIQV